MFEKTVELPLVIFSYTKYDPETTATRIPTPTMKIWGLFTKKQCLNRIAHIAYMIYGIITTADRNRR